MTPREFLDVVLRRWWLVVIVPAIVLPLLIIRAKTEPYQTTFKAVVLLPGDTEIPGSSERPELMVLDDLPVLVSSRVFAGAVVADLTRRGVTINAEDVQRAIAGTRYSRILTVSVTSERAGDGSAIAESAAAVLPAAVNSYLVADGERTATVDILDPPGAPSRSRPNQALIIAALTVLAAGVGVGLALLANGWSTGPRTLR